MYHHAVLKIGVAEAIIWPQLAVGGRMPTPRNESAASIRMFEGICRLANTMIGAVRLGRISRTMILASEAPSAREASTNSRSRSDSTRPLTMRAMYGQVANT